jgi:hypothetical protein
MLIKTPEFHKKFLQDVFNIAIVSRKYWDELNSFMMKNPTLQIKPQGQPFANIKFVGSYITKSYGKTITDIDLIQIFEFNEILVRRLGEILKNLSKTNFTFVRFYCGSVKELVPPWEINGEGSCKYNPAIARMWIKNLKGTTLLPTEVHKAIFKILYSLSISLKDILNIEKMLEPYNSLLWNKDDIILGYKIFNNKKITLLEALKTYKKKKTLKFMYKYDVPKTDPGDSSAPVREYCLIDVSLKEWGNFDTTKDSRLITEHYYNDPYTLFKAYRRLLKDEKREEYANYVRDRLGNLTGLAGRVELLQKIEKYKVLGDDEVFRLWKDLNEYSRKVEVFDEDETYEFYLIKEKLEDEVKDLLPSMKKDIDPKYIRDISIYEMRALECDFKIDQRVLEKRVSEGNDCPFFLLSVGEIEKIYDFGVKNDREGKMVLYCFYRACQTYNADPKVVVKNIF